jgi:VWFA-related protein
MLVSAQVRFLWTLAVLPAYSLVSVKPAAAQPAIRVNVTLVRVPFVATDSNGKLINNLRLNELVLTDNHAPQEIKYLWTEMDLPLTIGFVIDISTSQMGFVRHHVNSAEQFINRVLGLSDCGLVATVDEQPRRLIGLTASTAELLRAIESLRQQRHSGGLFGEPCQPPPRNAGHGTRACIGTAIWDGLFHLARLDLHRVEGRKALILLSDGLDLGASVHGLSSAIEASQTAGITVYTIRYLSKTYLALQPQLILQAHREHGMEDIAIQTGGRAFKDPKDMGQVYAEIERDLRAQSVLAYIPTELATSRAWHQLEIRTTRPGVNVRAQAGYFLENGH